jgi:hypothetical protein
MSIANLNKRNCEEFLSDPEALVGYVKNLVCLAKTPRFVGGIVSRIVTRRMKEVHLGQVAPEQMLWSEFVEALAKKGAIQIEGRIRDSPLQRTYCKAADCYQPLSGL